MNYLLEQFGNIDIYLFDQLLKGRFSECKNILDLGCGNGRNIYYFLKNAFNVYAVDSNAEAIDAVRMLNTEFAGLSENNFIHAQIDSKLNLPKNYFDLIICNAVLHFAQDRNHFEEMLFTAWNLLAPGGYFFARLASDIGIKEIVIELGKGRFLLPDGTERFLVSEEMIHFYNKKLNAMPYEAVKTTVVEGQRAMTTWCLQKPY